jgi:PTS system cellobiose-specific IIB component
VGVHLVGRLGSLEQLALAASVPVAVLPGETRSLDGDAALDLAISIAGART